jgi:hypothetical protein
VESTNGVEKSRVLGTRIYNIGHAQLLDAGEPLHERMLYDVQQKTARNLYETEHRIVDYLTVVQYLIVLSLLNNPFRMMGFHFFKRHHSFSLLLPLRFPMMSFSLPLKPFIMGGYIYIIFSDDVIFFAVETGFYRRTMSSGTLLPLLRNQIFASSASICCCSSLALLAATSAKSSPLDA